MDEKMKTASEFLEKAKELLDERGKQYDKPDGERSMGKAVEAFNIITNNQLSEADGWLLMQILKDVRLHNSPNFHQDSAEDCIAYAALKAEALSKPYEVTLIIDTKYSEQKVRNEKNYLSY